MVAVYALINKEVMPFVCSRKKVSIEYLCSNTSFQLEKINKWFNVADPSLPTINQAKKLSKCLHIPFAGLYMNVEDINIKAIPAIRNYRTFQGSLSIDDSGFNIAICDVLQERDFLIEESTELGLDLISFSAPLCLDNNPASWAKAIRNHFSIEMDEQYKCSSSRKFYLYLREKLERKGIFVQCFTDVPVEIARGFSIYEKTLPIIGINDKDRPPAKSFSLIHELVHIIKRESSVCNVMYNALSSQKEEVFCNAVAGELLVPGDALKIILRTGYNNRSFTVEDIGEIAKRFSVSREVVIRRLLDFNYIDTIEYETYSNEFRKEVERDREEQKIARKARIKTGIPKNVSREAVDRTSPAICKTLCYGYNEDIYSKRDIAQHLGIAQKHVDKFLLEVSKWSR